MSRASKAWLIQGDEPPVVPLSKGDDLLPIIAIFMAWRGLDKAIRDFSPPSEGPE